MMLGLFVTFSFASLLLNSEDKRRIYFVEQSMTSDINITLYRPISILFDTQYVDSSTGSEAVKILIKQIILPRVTQWAASFINVNGTNVIGKIAPDTCTGYIIPQNYTQDSSTSTGDLIIIAKTISSSSDNYIAKATFCAFSRENSRPLVGGITFNTAMINLDSELFENYIRIAMHEVIHVLVFNLSLYKYFKVFPLLPLNTSSSRYFFNSSNTINSFRKQLNCSGIGGLPLEDQGSTSSINYHYEKLILGNELMNSEASDEMVLSNITISLINDSGWYQASGDASEQFWWGKNKGCTFYTSAGSSRFDEFCAKINDITCSADYRSGALCSTNLYSNNCLVKISDRTFSCDQIYNDTSSFATLYNTRGPTSRCYLTTDTSSKKLFGCFLSRCNDNGTLTVVIKDNEYTCSSSTQIINIDPYKVQCPNITKFCGIMNLNSCPNDCSGYGYCKNNGGCNCRYGFSESDCSVKDQCTDSSPCNLISISNRGKNDMISTIFLYAFIFTFYF